MRTKNDKIYLKVDGIEPVAVVLKNNLVFNYDNTGIICGNPSELVIENAEDALMLDYLNGNDNLTATILTQDGQTLLIIGEINEIKHKFVLTIKYMRKI